MTALFKTRLQRHLREMAKYLRLVFNDFFVFALLFLLGEDPKGRILVGAGGCASRAGDCCADWPIGHAD